jgi:hypothetical protein
MTLRFGNNNNNNNNNNNIAKIKIAPVHAMKTFRGSRGLALLILHLAARWW